MTLDTFNAMLQEVDAEQRAIYNKALKLYTNGVRDLKEYKKIGAYSDMYWTSTGFLTVVKKNIDLDDGYSLDEMILALCQTKKEYKRCNEIGKTTIDIGKKVDDECLDFFGFEYSYFIIDEKKLDSEISRLIREKIKEALKPDTVKVAIMPDCKIVKLYKDGAIDWKTLQSITYANCKL